MRARRKRLGGGAVIIENLSRGRRAKRRFFDSLRSLLTNMITKKIVFKQNQQVSFRFAEIAS